MAPFQLEIQLTAAVFLRQPITPDQRGITFTYCVNRSIWRKWQIVFVLNQNALFKHQPPDFIINAYRRFSHCPYPYQLSYG